MSDSRGIRRAAEVFHDPDTGQLTVRIPVNGESLRDFWISKVNVQLADRDHPNNYGERNFIPPSAAFGR